MHVLAIDQGTTGTTCLIVNERHEVVARAYREFPQSYPQPGWVEHDPGRDLVERHSDHQSLPRGCPGGGHRRDRDHEPTRLTVVWDRSTGDPIYPAIVWQCRRTHALCEEPQSPWARGGLSCPYRVGSRSLF